MWLPPGVILPAQITKAYRDNKLVIFAGAGVSVDPPSNLPSFEGLAKRLGRGSILWEEPADSKYPKESIDRFLGRLKEAGIDVHKEIQQILDDSSSSPNSLHRALVEIFMTPERIRIVTTNSDRHFTTVAKQLFNCPVKTYSAPALPLGSDFRGIVYLHGSVTEDSQTLVYTDLDFGRAYLTQGWATRFLCDLFTANTVLFVGYSHKDEVLRYLARGLVPGSARFALTEPGNDGHWSYLNIIPIDYPVADPPNKHRALLLALNGWVEKLKMGALDHEIKVKRIVDNPPPSDPDDADYMEETLNDPERITFFCRHACTVDWLNWAEQQPTFKSLFRFATPSSDMVEKLAAWFADKYVVSHSIEAFSILHRASLAMSSSLWLAVAYRLFVNDTLPEPHAFSSWCVALMNSRHPGQQTYYLSYILGKCRYPEDRDTALLLLEYLAEPLMKPSLMPRFFAAALQQFHLTGSLRLLADGYQIKTALEKVFLSHMEYFALPLATLLGRYIERAHTLLQSIGSANREFDYLTMKRKSIELTDGHDRYEDIFVLVDAAREVIRWLVTNRYAQSQAIIEIWILSEAPLSRRLAIFGFSQSPTLEPDDKLSWLLKQNCLFEPFTKYEIFQLLKSTYPVASDAMRLQVLNVVQAGPRSHGEIPDDPEETEYTKYNLYTWLTQAAPSCSLALERLDRIQIAYPHFIPREAPELDFSFKTVAYQPQSPFSADAMLQMPSRELAEQLLKFNCLSDDKPNRRGLLGVFQAAASRAVDWSWKVFQELQRTETWPKDIVPALLSGWSNATFSEDQWHQLLTFLERRPGLCEDHLTLLWFIRNRLEQRNQGIPESCLSLAESIADKLFEGTHAWHTSPVRYYEHVIDDAINHPGGVAVEIWLLSLSRRRIAAADAWQGIPNGSKAYLNRVLDGSSGSSAYGRVMLFGRVFFLLNIDNTWVVTKVLPRMDWSVNPETAREAWHGYMVIGQWDEKNLPTLLPLIEKTFPQVKTQLSDIRSRICAFLASISIHSTIDHLVHGWLLRFIDQSDNETRVEWARNVHFELSGLSESGQRQVWLKWMDSYWNERLRGNPKPLLPEELHEMLSWMIHLKPVFTSVVDRILTSEPSPSLPPMFYDSLAETDLATRFPEPMIDLLNHLLSVSIRPDQSRHLKQLVTTLVKQSVPAAKTRRLCELLGKAGYDFALELRHSIGNSTA